jgi:cytochrome c biogenesis protein CcdA
MASWGLAFLAGLLTSLSPCVLPLLPLVLGAAAGKHRFGPVALAAGLALSYVAVGLFVATIGFAIGLDGDVFRRISAVMLVGLGLILLLPQLQARFATAAGPVGGWADERLSSLSPSGLGGQFLAGMLLGAVWSPCAGPTLGAASLLAAQGRDLGSVAVTMMLFGVGAALPLLLIGMASRQTIMRWRGKLMSGGTGMKKALGVMLIVIALAVLSGFDQRLESVLVDASPAWLTDLTTRF